MTLSKAKRLAPLLRSAGKSKLRLKPATSPAEASGLELLPSFSNASTSASRPSAASKLAESAMRTSAPFGLTGSFFDQTSEYENSESSAEHSAGEIRSLLASHDSSDHLDGTYSDISEGEVLHLPWISPVANNNVSLRRKLTSRHRRSRWIFNSGQSRNFYRLFELCKEKVGVGRTLAVFSKLGKETGLKEYHASIAACVENAERTHDKDAALEDLAEAFRLFNEMRELGFVLEEAAYGPLLLYFVDRRMVDEFFFFCDSIKEGKSVTLPRLGYYEMLLWIKVDDEEKIQELCNFIAEDEKEDTLELRENYLSALCECDRKDELVRLLKILDLTQVSSLANIFKSLGRLSLESLMEKLLLRFRACDHMVDCISDLIFSYSASIPNLADLETETQLQRYVFLFRNPFPGENRNGKIFLNDLKTIIDLKALMFFNLNSQAEEVLVKYESLHARVDVVPSSSSHEKLISYCCDLEKVHLALGIVDQMCDAGYSCSIVLINRILHLCENAYDLGLVWRIYSLICQHDVKADVETFRSMINMCVRMKDFKGAFSLLDDMKKMNVAPTTIVYNSIMAGYFREKRVSDASTVLKQMELDSVRPDSQTYSYLISNCGNEENILKFYDKWKSTNAPPTKHIFMALINAYASCGEFEKAKQVLLDKDIPIRSKSELKSVLIGALASSGRVSDAVVLYEEIKEAGWSLEPKAVIALIEHSKSKDALPLLLQLLEALQNHEYWDDGCCRVVAFCIKNKHLRCAIDLLKQRKDRFQDDELAVEFMFDEVFPVVAELDPPDLQIGLDLLQAVKDEFGVTPSRNCLDFLLNLCTNAKDLTGSNFIWKEYKKAGYEYNVVNYLRMYQALLACGDHKSAERLRSKIPKEDSSVCYIIKLCQKTYLKSTSAKAKRSRAKERLSE